MDKMVNGEIVVMEPAEEAEFLATRGQTEAEEIASIKQKLIDIERNEFIDSSISQRITAIENMPLAQLRIEHQNKKALNAVT